MKTSVPSLVSGRGSLSYSSLPAMSQSWRTTCLYHVARTVNETGCDEIEGKSPVVSEVRMIVFSTPPAPTRTHLIRCHEESWKQVRFLVEVKPTDQLGFARPSTQELSSRLYQGVRSLYGCFMSCYWSCIDTRRRRGLRRLA